MTKGDKVKFIDHSGSLTLDNGDFKHKCAIGGYYTGHEFVVVLTSEMFPAAQMDIGYPYVNDVLLYSRTNGDYVLTQEMFLEPISYCKHCKRRY
jgi:hypothetical protein